MSSIVLLVDDNEQITYANKRMLKRRGYDVLTALSLSEARKRMKETAPDVIVLDIMLPDGNGLDFMRELRQASNAPILFLSGFSAQEDIVRKIKENGDDYLTKPYDFDILPARIEALIRRGTPLPKNSHKCEKCDLTRVYG